MTRIIFAIVALLLGSVAANATCTAPLSILDSGGTARTMATTLDGSSNCQQVVIDTSGANFASIVSAINASQGTAAAPMVSASAAVNSLVLRNSPTTTTGGVKYFHAENITATAGYCILYNGTAAPSAGALTPTAVLAFQYLPANGYCDWSAKTLPIAASSGAVVLVSSATTPFTYTTGTVTAGIYGLAQ